MISRLDVSYPPMRLNQKCAPCSRQNVLKITVRLEKFKNDNLRIPARAFWREFVLEAVEILLCCQRCILAVIVQMLRKNIVDHARRQQVEVPEGQPDLQTAEQEQRCGHFPVSRAKFFLD